jgi:hypothetical protein
MAGLAETWSNIEVRSVIRFLWLKGTSPAEIHHQLVQVYSANVMSQKHVWVWCTAFDKGKTDVQDEQWSGQLARPHTTNHTCELLRRYNWEVLDHPPYSPDLAQSDFHLCGPLKKHLFGRWFATNSEVQQAVMSWLQALDTDFLYAGIDALVYQWDKCLGKYGDYVEK